MRQTHFVSSGLKQAWGWRFPFEPGWQMCSPLQEDKETNLANSELLPDIRQQRFMRLVRPADLSFCDKDH